MHQAVVEVGTDICQDIDEAYSDVYTSGKPFQMLPENCGVSGWAHPGRTLSATGKAS